MTSLENKIEKRLESEGVENASTLAALIAIDIEQDAIWLPRGLIGRITADEIVSILQSLKTLSKSALS